MKIKLSTRKDRGVILLVCLGGAILIGIGMISVLYMVQAESKTVARSQAWNNAMVVSEAGIEEGMALINKNATTSTSANGWTTTAAGDGWTQSGNVFSLRRDFDAGYYQVYVTNLGLTSVSIKSIGTVLWTNGPVYPLVRAVLVNPSLSSKFSGAIAVKKTVTIVGVGVVDSVVFTNGSYDLIHPGTRGDILVGSSTSVATVGVRLSGTPAVHGHVYLGPNNSVNNGGTAIIGDYTFAGPGIQSGWVNNTANFSIPDAPAIPTPAYSWNAMPAKTNGVYYLNGGGPLQTNYYQMTSSFGNLNSSDKIVVTNGTVVLDVEEDFAMTAQSTMEVAANAKLLAWFNGNPSFGGGGIVNNGGNATNVTIYGTANCTEIKYTGSGNFIGVMYAPYADITFSGGSSLIGSIVGNSFTGSGGSGIHFDEALAQDPSGIYVVFSWLEVLP